MIKDNKTAQYPSHFIFFDTETNVKEVDAKHLEHTLRLGTAIYWRRREDRLKDNFEWCHFTTINQFWDFVEAHCSARDRLFIIAHNLPFDMGIVKGFSQLETRGFEVVKMIFDNRKNIWKFRKGTTSLLFLDNMNYFNTSLELLGSSVGLSKLTMPPFEANDSEWWTYCQRDTEVLYHTWRHWLSFLKGNDLGTFGLTIASQAFNAYRHRFMTIPIYVHTSAKAVKIERASYRGGRTECFFIGKLPRKKYYLLDVNSMYAYMLKTYPYPVNLKSTGKHLSLFNLYTLLHDYCVIAEVDVNTPEPCYGVKIDGRLTFPVGKFKVTLNSIELYYALVHNYIELIHSYSVYEKAHVFSDYVDYFQAKKVEFINKGEDVYTYLCKIMLNSLYGKFGQAIEEWKPVGYDETRLYDYWTEWDIHERKLHTYRCLNYWVEEKVGSQEGYNSLVAIPSEVTAYARMYLWNLIKRAGNDHVFYCDTDSLIVDKQGLENLSSEISSTDIGKLRVQDTAMKLHIHGLKDYVFGNKVTIKGIPKSAVKLADDVYEVYQSLGIKSGLHHQEINNVIWRKLEKHLNRVYKKGVVTETGKVEPIVLGERG